MKRSKAILGVLAVAMVLSLAGATQAAVTYFGVDEDGTNGAWRTSADSAYDADGGTEYGTDGYFIAHEGAGGYGAATTNLESTPSYVSSMTWAATIFTWDGDLGPGQLTAIDNPAGGTGEYGAAHRPGAEDPGDFITVTLSQDASFRLGVFNDAWTGTLNYDPTDYIAVTQAGSAVDSDDCSADMPGDWENAGLNQQIDYYFFDLSGQAGDTFTISAARDPGRGGLGIFLKGITFDSPAPIPEPATMSLLALGGLGALIRRRRK